MLILGPSILILGMALLTKAYMYNAEACKTGEKYIYYPDWNKILEEKLKVRNNALILSKNVVLS